MHNPPEIFQRVTNGLFGKLPPQMSTGSEFAVKSEHVRVIISAKKMIVWNPHFPKHFTISIVFSFPAENTVSYGISV